jgi:hypothetical protein
MAQAVWPDEGGGGPGVVSPPLPGPHKLQVFILTSGRVGHQVTLESLCCSKEWHKLVDLKIVIPKTEKAEWEKTHPAWVSFLHCVNESWRVEDVRQHVLEKFLGEFHLVLDDDLKIYRKLGVRTLERLTDSMFFLEHVGELLGKYKHGSIASHTSHHFKGPGLYVNERAGGVHFYHRSVLLKHCIDYRCCLEHEDMHSTLVLIKNGVPNVVSYHFVFVQKTNAKGGCSKYRTLETQNRHAQTLLKHHRPFVKLSTKLSKLWGGEKVCVMVYWKKAFAASKMPKETIAPMKVLKGSGRKPKAPPPKKKKKRKLLAKDSTDAQGHANKKSTNAPKPPAACKNVSAEKLSTAKFSGKFFDENGAARSSISVRIQILYLQQLSIFERDHQDILTNFGNGKLVGRTIQIYCKPQRQFWTVQCVSYDNARGHYTLHKCPTGVPIQMVEIALKDAYLLKWTTT